MMIHGDRGCFASCTDSYFFANLAFYKPAVTLFDAELEFEQEATYMSWPANEQSNEQSSTSCLVPEVL